MAIHSMATRGNARSASSSPMAVVGDHSIAIGEELALLAFPRVAIEWIAMDQDDRAATAVVLVVNLNWSAVLGADGDRSHCLSPFLGLPLSAGSNTRMGR